MLRTTASRRHLGGHVVAVALLLLSAHVARVAAQDKAGSPSPEDSVGALESARAQALLHADTTALSRMTADEFVEVSRLGTLRTKADNIREIGSGGLKLVGLTATFAAGDRARRSFRRVVRRVGTEVNRVGPANPLEVIHPAG